MNIQKLGSDDADGCHLPSPDKPATSIEFLRRIANSPAGQAGMADRLAIVARDMSIERKW